MYGVSSGCTSHLCKDKDAKLGDKDTERINLASNSPTAICGKGKVIFSADVAGKTKDIEMNEVLFVPDLRANLMSVAKITDRNFLVTFDRDKAKIYDRKGNVKLIATRKDNLYYIHKNSKHECRIASNQNSTLETWHYRLGHMNIRDLRHAIRSGVIRGIDDVKLSGDFECETCIKGKMSRPVFSKESDSTPEILELIHTGICRPMRIESNGGTRYFITFIDCSRWCEMRFLKSKDQALKAKNIRRSWRTSMEGTLKDYDLITDVSS